VLLATAVGAVLQARPPAVSPYAQGRVCSVPVAVATRRGLLLDCADAPHLRACAAEALDVVVLQHGVCQRQPDAMPQAWRNPLGYPLDVNRASMSDFQALTAVGPATASAIVATRAKLGYFATLDDLQAVPGLGPHMLALLRPHLTCRPKARLALGPSLD
jgi:competence protein ComEA